MTAGWMALSAFGAGLGSCVGPCLAPRMAAVASLTAGVGSGGRLARLAGFVLGLCLGYVALGTVAGVLALVNAATSYVYAGIAAAMMATGLATIVGRAPCCPTEERFQLAGSPGAAVLAGLALVAAGGPCCGPLAAAFAAIPSAGGETYARAEVLAAFALGHAAPLVAFAGGSARVAECARAFFPQEAGATIGGALMVALGGYYAVLA